MRFQAVIQERPETRGFKEFLLGLDPERVEVRIPDKPLLASVFGIRGKEVLLCYHMLDRSIGIHFNDPVTTQYIEKAFDSVWQNATKVQRKEVQHEK